MNKFNMKFDFALLYPDVIQQHNITPDSHADVMWHYKVLLRRNKLDKFFEANEIPQVSETEG